MVTDFGMSDKLGPRTFGDKQELIFLGREISEQKDYGDKIANVIDEEVDKIIGNAHDLAKKILTENKPKLIELAQKLLKRRLWKVKNWTRFSVTLLLSQLKSSPSRR